MEQILGQSDKEVLEILQQSNPDSIIAGPAVRNKYYNLPVDEVDIYLNYKKISSFSNWADYMLPELFDFDEEKFYTFNDLHRRRVQSTMDEYVPSFLRGRNTYSKRNIKPLTLMKISSMSIKNRLYNLHYVNCNPIYYLNKYPFSLNIDVCYFNGVKEIYTQAFNEADKRKEVDVIGDPSINSHNKASQFLQLKHFNKMFKLSPRLEDFYKEYLKVLEKTNKKLYKQFITTSTSTDTHVQYQYLGQPEQPVAAAGEIDIEAMLEEIEPVDE